MPEDPVLAIVDQQEWLAPIQEKGQELVLQAFESAGETGLAIKNALHGVWLKHPLHAAITDVPVGSWTAAAVLDVLDATGRDEYAPGADAAVAIGLVGAVASAASGLADWSETHGKAQRVGAMHGLLNTAAALLYGSSYAFRKSGNRGLGRACGFVGYGLVLASAYLGGALSYNQKIGVNHAPLENELPEDWQAALAESELNEGQPKSVDVAGVPVMLLKRQGEIVALANSCSHLGGPLAEGKIDGDTVICPWHGSRFCLKDGSVVNGPATTNQPKLDVKVENGQIFVKK